jgi:mannose PTS system EIIC component
MIKEAFCAGTLGALLWLDRYQIGQFMISRPIVVGPIIGWALGDIALGLAVGVLFEVLWLRRPPIGGFIAPDVTFSTAIASSVAIIVKNQFYLDTLALALLSFMLFMPLSFVGSKLDLLLRMGLGKLAPLTEQAILERDNLTIGLFFAASVILGFTICLTAEVPIIILGTVVLKRIVEVCPESLIAALKFAYFAVPAIGALDMLAGNFERFSVALFVIGFISTLLCYLFL